MFLHLYPLDDCNKNTLDLLCQVIKSNSFEYSSASSKMMYSLLLQWEQGRKKKTVNSIVQVLVFPYVVQDASFEPHQCRLCMQQELQQVHKVTCASSFYIYGFSAIGKTANCSKHMHLTMENSKPHIWSVKSACAIHLCLLYCGFPLDIIK